MPQDKINMNYYIGKDIIIKSFKELKKRTLLRLWEKLIIKIF